MTSPFLPSARPTLAALVAGGVLDAPIAALSWLLLERGVPVLVAGRDTAACIVLGDALVEALPEERRPRHGTGGPAGERGRLVRVAAPIGPASSPGIARAALALTTGRSGLLAAVEADGLEGVLQILVGQGLSPEETSFLGVVLAFGGVEDRDAAHAGGIARGNGGQRESRSKPGEPAEVAPGHSVHRLAVAHYLRPIVRDAGGHVRRLPPAVLAARDPRTDRWEDYSWGVVSELAERARMGVGELEDERDRRSALLARQAAARLPGASRPG